MHLKDAAREEQEALRLLLSESERTRMLRGALQAPETNYAQDGLKRFRLAIGPEGGWTPEEETLFTTEGWTAVSLGPRILRAETAAIAAISIVAALLE